MCFIRIFSDICSVHNVASENIRIFVRVHFMIFAHHWSLSIPDTLGGGGLSSLTYKFGNRSQLWAVALLILFSTILKDYLFTLELEDFVNLLKLIKTYCSSHNRNLFGVLTIALA